jgi:hypothetical protein
MNFLITDGGDEFVFPAERIVGRIPALHPLDEFELHRAQVAAARAESNKQFSRTTETKTKNTK